FGPKSTDPGVTVPPVAFAGDFIGSAGKGDGYDDLIVYRPDISLFTIRNMRTGAISTVSFGPGSAFTGATVPPVGLAGGRGGAGSAALASYRPDTSHSFGTSGSRPTAAGPFFSGPGSP